MPFAGFLVRFDLSDRGIAAAPDEVLRSAVGEHLTITYLITQYQLLIRFCTNIVFDCVVKFLICSDFNVVLIFGMRCISNQNISAAVRNEAVVDLKVFAGTLDIFRLFK